MLLAPNGLPYLESQWDEQSDLHPLWLRQDQAMVFSLLLLRWANPPRGSGWPKGSYGCPPRSPIRSTALCLVSGRWVQFEAASTFAATFGWGLFSSRGPTGEGDVDLEHGRHSFCSCGSRVVAELGELGRIRLAC